MPMRHVNLTDSENQFIEAGVSSGRFSDANEAVRAGLHLLEREHTDEEAKIAWLRNAAQQGVDALERGDYAVLHSSDEIDAYVRSAGSARR